MDFCRLKSDLISQGRNRMLSLIIIVAFIAISPVFASETDDIKDIDITICGRSAIADRWRPTGPSGWWANPGWKRYIERIRWKSIGSPKLLRLFLALYQAARGSQGWWSGSQFWKRCAGYPASQIWENPVKKNQNQNRNSAPAIGWPKCFGAYHPKYSDHGVA